MTNCKDANCLYMYKYLLIMCYVRFVYSVFFIHLKFKLNFLNKTIIFHTQNINLTQTISFLTFSYHVLTSNETVYNKIFKTLLNSISLQNFY